MSRIKPKRIDISIIKAWLNCHEIAYLSEVKPSGNGGYIKAFKQHIGKEALILIRNKE